MQMTTSFGSAPISSRALAAKGVYSRSSCDLPCFTGLTGMPLRWPPTHTRRAHKHHSRRRQQMGDRHTGSGATTSRLVQDWHGGGKLGANLLSVHWHLLAWCTKTSKARPSMNGKVNVRRDTGATGHSRTENLIRVTQPKSGPTRMPCTALLARLTPWTLVHGRRSCVPVVACISHSTWTTKR